MYLYTQKPDVPRENDAYWDEDAKTTMVYSRGDWWQFGSIVVEEYK